MRTAGDISVQTDTHSATLWRTEKVLVPVKMQESFVLPALTTKGRQDMEDDQNGMQEASQAQKGQGQQQGQQVTSQQVSEGKTPIPTTRSRSPSATRRLQPEGKGGRNGQERRAVDRSWNAYCVRFEGKQNEECWCIWPLQIMSAASEFTPYSLGT